MEMSLIKKTILPEGMYWSYNPLSKTFCLVVEKNCEYRKSNFSISFMNK